MRETSLSFCPFDSTWQSMVRLTRDNTTTQSAFNFLIKMKMAIFVFIVVVAACVCFVVAWYGISRLSASLIQQVLRMWRVVQVSHGCVFYCFLWVHYCLFVVVLDVLVAGDLRYEYAQSTWGFLFRGPSPGSWLHLSCLHHGNWCSFDGDWCHVMSIVMILTMSSWCLCCVCWQGRLVAPRMIATTLLVALEELLSQERFCPSQWRHWFHPLWWSLTVPIAVDDGFVACCCLLRLCLVPMLALCSQLGFLMV